MVITFKDKKLGKIANDDRKMLSQLGKIRAAKFKQRLDDMRAAFCLEDLRFAPGHYHELVGDKKGEWACDLDQPFRLTFSPHENPIPVNDHGQYLWDSICGIEILEITNYH